MGAQVMRGAGGRGGGTSKMQVWWTWVSVHESEKYSFMSCEVEGVGEFWERFQIRFEFKKLGVVLD
jgi:uncharacterized protein involved in high-affinity Fe2+ transport